MVFIPYTSGGQLWKPLQDVDDRTTKVLGMGRTKYVERAGVALVDSLVDKNVWRKLQGGCNRRHCYPCKSSGGEGISCRAEGFILWSCRSQHYLYREEFKECCREDIFLVQKRGGSRENPVQLCSLAAFQRKPWWTDADYRLGSENHVHP